MTTTTLLLIDPQNDFMDVERASLPVPGADADMRRVAAYIRAQASEIDDIVVTLDSHELLDIGHHLNWRDGRGAIPPPFTRVTHEDVRNGRFRPADSGALPRVLAYLEALEALGRYTHTLWPVHCQIGSWGHNLHPEVLDACNH